MEKIATAVFWILLITAAVYGIWRAASSDRRTEIDKSEYKVVDRMMQDFPVICQEAQKYAQDGMITKYELQLLAVRYDQLEFEKTKQELLSKLEVKK